MQRTRLCREQAVLGAHVDVAVVGVADVEEVEEAWEFDPEFFFNEMILICA